MIADTDPGSLSIPGVSGLAALRRPHAAVNITVNAPMLTPSVDAGRAIAQSVSQYTRLNGTGR